MKNFISLILFMLAGTTMALAQNKKTYVPKPADDTMFLPVTFYDPVDEIPVEDLRKYQLANWVNQIKEHYCESQAFTNLENSVEEATHKSNHLVARQTKDHPQHPFGLNSAGFTVPFP